MSQQIEHTTLLSYIPSNSEIDNKLAEIFRDTANSMGLEVQSQIAQSAAQPSIKGSIKVARTCHQHHSVSSTDGNVIKEFHSKLQTSFKKARINIDSLEDKGTVVICFSAPARKVA